MMKWSSDVFASAPLIGFLSCGQADMTAIKSSSTLNPKTSPCDETVASKEVWPSGEMGIFIHKLNGSGTCGASSPIALNAIRKLSVQLSWYSVHPNNWYRVKSQQDITVSCTPGDVSLMISSTGWRQFVTSRSPTLGKTDCSHVRQCDIDKNWPMSAARYAQKSQTCVPWVFSICNCCSAWSLTATPQRGGIRYFTPISGLPSGEIALVRLALVPSYLAWS